MRSNCGRVQCLEMAAIASFIARKESRDFIRRHRPFLKTPLRKHGHLHAEYRADSARDDLSLERIESLMRPSRQLGEWNRLCNCDHSGPSVGAERVEAILSRACVAAYASTTIPARVREGVLDRL